ncbi:MAG: HlyD family efflux transporter periplasmic adaptor subunit, partial [Kiritimatiellales bacterium]|nr:HlyD family efflux transporter periplasmic adaptor subunit [Kiritimatiellales bacterium]
VVVTTIDNAAPLEPGRLTGFYVKTGDPVVKGAPLAQMDTSLLKAEKDVVEASDTALHGELAAVSAEVSRLEPLLKQQLVSEQELQALRIKQKTLQSSIDSAELEKKIRLLDMRIENCTLRAQADGVVSRLLHSPGDIVQSGDPVLYSVINRETSVEGFLSESNARDVYIGMDAYLTPASGYGETVRAKVVALTPEIFNLPGRVNPVPQRTYRGRRVILIPEPGAVLLPGEEIQINLRRPWTLQIFRNLIRKEQAQ